ncbi:MAG: hypothetical protein ABSD20_21335 [Terriglobales bacterium]|jgi:hypothetical protein
MMSTPNKLRISGHRLYHKLNATERKAVSIDYLVMAAGADVHNVSGVIQEEISRAEGICLPSPRVRTRAA